MGINGPDDVTLSAGLDAGSASALSSVIENAIGKGFTEGFSTFTSALNKNVNFNKFGNKLRDSAKEAFDPKIFASVTRGLEGITAEFSDLIAKFKQANTETQILNTSLRGLSSIRRQDAIAERTATQQSEKAKLLAKEAAGKQAAVIAQGAAQKELAITKQLGAEQLQVQRAQLDSLGREERVAGELTVNAAKASAKQRIAITRGLIEGIVALEKGLGTAVEGVARTTTAAVSRTFSAMGSTLKTIFHRSNADVTEGLNTSLNKRETIMRESFRTQERIVSSSVSRQERQLTELRTLTSKGVAGAITGRGIGLGIGGLVAGIGIGQIFKNGFQDATNLTEQLNKNRVVFGDFADDVINFSKTSVTALGSTQAAALEATGTFGNLFRAIGLSEEQSSGMSTRLTTLATDLASFNNSSVTDAFEAIRSGLVGEQEPLRKFGVNLNDATLKAKALELGLYNGKGVLNANAKAQAAYALILDQTTLAQGDWARTVDQGANAQRRAKAAADQLASTIAGKLKGAVTDIANAAVPVFITLTNLVSGENLSAGMQVLRDGLQGIALGLGAVLAAKGGVEVIKLLGLALQFAVTPMGLLIIGAATLGAAFEIFYKRSETVRNAVDGLVAKVKELGTELIDRLSPVFTTVVNFIQDTAIPAIINFAGAVADHLLDAFDATVAFVRTQVIPVLQSLWSFLLSKLIPAAQVVGNALVLGFQTARDAVQSFFTFIHPLIQPAIDGFAKLGSAVGKALGGDFSKLLGGLGAAGAGIGKAAANIGVLIFNALKPVGARIADFFKSIFTAKNLKGAFDSVLDFVEFVGRTIGLIATNPTVVSSLLKVAAALAAAAVLIGFRFAKGLIEGIVHNLPGLGRLVVDGLKLLFDPDVLVPVILAAFAFAAIVQPIRRLFQTIGQEGAKSFATGFKTSLGNSLSTASAALNPGKLLSPSAGAKGFFSDTLREVDTLQLKLSALGSKTRVAPGGILDEAKIKAARTEVEQLSGRFTDAQVKGLIMRQTFNDTFGALKTGFSGVKSGIGEIGKATGHLVTDFASLGSGGFLKRFATGIKDGGGTIRSAFSDTLTSLRATAAANGTTLGKAIGKSVAKGFGAALIGGLAGFETGKAVGASGGGALMAVLSGALTGGLSGGLLGPGGAAVGAVVGAGAAGIGQAMGKSQKAAEDFKSKVKELAGAIKTDLGAALTETTTKIDVFAAAMQKGADSAFFKQIAETLGPDLIAKMNALGVSAQDIAAAFAGAPAGQTGFGLLLDKLKGLSGGDALKVNTAMQELKVGFDQASGAAKFLNPNLDATINNFDRLATMGKEAVTTAPIIAAVTSASTQLANYQTVIDVTNQKLFDLFHPQTDAGSLQQSIDQAIVAVTNFGSELQANIEGPMSAAFKGAQQRLILGEFGDSVAGVIQKGIETGTVVDENSARLVTQGLLDAALAGVTDKTLREAITKAYEDGISAVQPVIDTSKAAAEGAKIAGAMQGYIDTHPLTPDIVDGTPAAEAYVLSVRDYFTAHPVKPGVEPNTPAAVSAATAMATAIANQVSLLTTGKTLGAQLAQGIAFGIDANTRTATAAAQRLADAVIKRSKDAFVVASPSKVMYEIGQNVADGLSLGITDGSQDLGTTMSDALDKAVEQFLDHATGVSGNVRSVISKLFGQSVGSGSLGASGGTATGLGDSIAGFTQAIAGISSSFDTVVGNFFEANKALTDKKNPATRSQLDLIGENVFGLDPTETSGIANRASIITALDSVKSIGDALLASGRTPQQVAEQLQQYVSRIVEVSDSLGLAHDQVITLVDQLGLSNEALSEFSQATNKATNTSESVDEAVRRVIFGLGQVADAADVIPADPNIGKGGERLDGTDEGGASGNTDFTLANLPRQTPVIVNVYPQYGDPLAIGVAAANAVASEVVASSPGAR